MGLSYKGYNDEVFAIFNGKVYSASVVGAIANNRGAVTSKRLRFEPTDQDNPILADIGPIVAEIRKRYIFQDEDTAKKALFTFKLKGEVK